MIVGRPKHEIEERTKAIRLDFVRRYPGMDALRLELFNKQSGLCTLCIKELAGWDNVQATVDHSTSVYIWAQSNFLIDEATEHANKKENLVLAHPECNNAKNALELEEFHQQITSGETIIGEPRKWTPEEIEKEKQRLSVIGRMGSRNQPREAKVRGGRNQLRKDKARGGRRGSHEDKVRAGRMGGRISVRNQPREVKAVSYTHLTLPTICSV